MSDFPHLLAPITLAGVRLQNRLLMGSMHTGLEERGDWARVATYYARRAQGGVGLIVTGGVAPNAEGALAEGAAAMMDARDVANHRVLTDAVHAEGGRILMQILHAGRYGVTPRSVAPSALRAPISPFTPQELDEAGIAKQIADFAQAARLAVEAGYDGVEIMGSEGYLLNQFLARATNRRTDRWGAQAADRQRLPIAVVAAVRAAMGVDKILLYRASLLDLVADGQSWDEVTSLARGVATAGADAINSGFGWHEARIPTIAAMVPRAAFVDLTARLRGVVDVPVIASNRINTPEVAEAILGSGQADMVSMARPLLADPDFLAKARAGKSREITPCIACNQACLDHTFSGKVATCLVNPGAAHEAEFAYALAAQPKKVTIVGAGPAGLSCAIAAAQRGHSVTLFDQSPEIGGQLLLAAQVPGKEEFLGLLAYYRHMLELLKIDLRLNHRARPDDLANADVVVLATGVRPRPAGIVGEDQPHVLRYDEVLSGARKAQGAVAIIGAGGIGFDVATYLTEAATPTPEDWRKFWGITDPAVVPGGTGLTIAKPLPAPVTLMQRKAEKPGRGLGKTTGWIHRTALAAHGVRMLGGVSYTAIHPGYVAITRDGQTENIAADSVVICAGQVSQRDLDWPGAHVIGGAELAVELDAKRAIEQGTRLALTF